MNFLKNKWLIGGILVYFASLAALFRSDKYSAEELISVMFGIVWIRTRNLFVLMFIHAFVDLLPNLAEFIKVWKI